MRGPSRAGSPICHFLSLCESSASQIRCFLTGCISSAGPPPQGNDGRRVHSHCRHLCGAGFCRQVSGTAESLRLWPVRGERGGDWGSPGGETSGLEGLPPSQQPSLFGEAWTLEKPTSGIKSRALAVTPVGWRPLPRFSRPPSCRGQRRLSASPAPLLPPPARGSRRGGGAQRTLEPSRRCRLLPPHSWRAPPVGFPKQPERITNRDLAPKKKKKRKALQEKLDRWGRWAGPQGRDLAPVFAGLRRRWSRGRGPEEAGKLPLFGAARPEPGISAVGHREAVPRGLRSPRALLPAASRFWACGGEHRGSLDCGSVGERRCFWGFWGMRSIFPESCLALCALAAERGW